MVFAEDGIGLVSMRAFESGTSRRDMADQRPLHQSQQANAATGSTVNEKMACRAEADKGCVDETAPKYKSAPGKVKPQRENTTATATNCDSIARPKHRRLGAEGFVFVFVSFFFSIKQPICFRFCIQ